MTREEFRNIAMLAWITVYNISRLDLTGAVLFAASLDQDERKKHSADLTMLSTLAEIKPDVEKLAFPPVEEPAAIDRAQAP